MARAHEEKVFVKMFGFFGNYPASAPIMEVIKYSARDPWQTAFLTMQQGKWLLYSIDDRYVPWELFMCKNHGQKNWASRANPWKNITTSNGAIT